MLAKNDSSVIPSLLDDLSALIGVPRSGITIDDIRVGSLIVEFTVTRNATYTIPDDVINSILLSALFNHTQYTYQVTLNTTESTPVLSIITVKSSINPANTKSCDTTCIAGVAGGVAGFIFIVVIIIVCVLKMKRATKDRSATIAFEPTHVDDDGSSWWNDVNLVSRMRRPVNNDPIETAFASRHRIVVHRLRQHESSSSSGVRSVGDSSMEESAASTDDDDVTRYRNKALTPDDNDDQGNADYVRYVDDLEEGDHFEVLFTDGEGAGEGGPVLDEPVVEFVEVEKATGDQQVQFEDEVEPGSDSTKREPRQSMADPSGYEDFALSPFPQGRHATPVTPANKGTTRLAASGATPPHRQPDFDESAPLWSPLGQQNARTSAGGLFSPDARPSRSSTIILGTPQAVGIRNARGRSEIFESLPSTWLHEAIRQQSTNTAASPPPNVRRQHYVEEQQQQPLTVFEDFFTDATPAQADDATAHVVHVQVSRPATPPSSAAREVATRHAEAGSSRWAEQERSPSVGSSSQGQRVSRHAGSDTYAIYVQPSPTPQRDASWIRQRSGPHSEARSESTRAPRDPRAVSAPSATPLPSLRAVILGNDDGGESATIRSQLTSVSARVEPRQLPWMTTGAPSSRHPQYAPGPHSRASSQQPLPPRPIDASDSGTAAQSSRSAPRTGEGIASSLAVAIDTARTDNGGDAEELFVGIVSSRATSSLSARSASASDTRGGLRGAVTFVDDDRISRGRSDEVALADFDDVTGDVDDVVITVPANDIVIESAPSPLAAPLGEGDVQDWGSFALQQLQAASPSPGKKGFRGASRRLHDDEEYEGLYLGDLTQDHRGTSGGARAAEEAGEEEPGLFGLDDEEFTPVVQNRHQQLSATYYSSATALRGDGGDDRSIGSSSVDRLGGAIQHT